MTIARCQEERRTEDARLTYLTEQYHQISGWALEFVRCTNDEKKMILARIAEKITVDRAYHITLYFYVSLEDFEGKAFKNESPVSVTDAQFEIQKLVG